MARKRSVTDGEVPTGRNRLSGRKPAISEGDSEARQRGCASLTDTLCEKKASRRNKEAVRTPRAGAIKNADLTAGHSEPGPSEDLRPRPKIDGRFGTHMGSTVHLPGDPLPKRRTIKTDAK